MQHDGVRMAVQVVGDPGIELCAAQCHRELIGRRTDISMDTPEVVIDTRDVLYYASVMGVCLLVATLSLESRRWR